MPLDRAEAPAGCSNTRRETDAGPERPLITRTARDASAAALSQSITVVTDQLMKDQLMTSIEDLVRYVPGVTAHQGENNRASSGLDRHVLG